MERNVYILLDNQSQQIPFMQGFELDPLIARFVRGKLPELKLDRDQCHRVWHMYTQNGWRYIEVFVDIVLPTPPQPDAPSAG